MKHGLFGSVLAISLFAGWGLTLHGQASLGAQVSDIRQQARPELLALTGGIPTPERLLDLALLTSGAPVDALPAYRAKMAGVLERARNAIADSSAPPGEALLIFLHGKTGVFRGYQARQTRLDVALDTGVFNCVSSALAYAILASYLGLEVQAVGTRDHAFCTINQDGRMVDVETTIAYGYDPGRRQDFRDSFGKLTGIIWVPPSNYSTRRQLDLMHLVELVLQNLASDAQERRDSISPVGLAWDGAALIGLADARPLLIAAYNNRAAQLNDQNDFAGAMKVALAMEDHLGISPESDNLVQGIAGNMIQTALKNRDWSSAHQLLLDWQSRLGKTWRGLAINLYRLESQDRFASQGWNGLLAWLAGQELDPDWGKAEYSAALEMGISAELARLTKAGNWQAGWDFLGALPPAQQALPVAVRRKATVEHNLVADAHNRFASLANAGQLREARAAIAEALLRFPQNSLLKKDQETIDRLSAGQ